MVFVGLVGAPAIAQAPIQPKQHFVGLVNGKGADAVVKTVCPGPATSGREGQVLRGQTVSVVRMAKGAGYTGPFGQVNVWFVPRQQGPAPMQMQLTEYGQPLAIPTSIRVPCSGVGQVEFSSCPYLAPCAFGWVPTSVKVRFVNVAA
jgi:hypothetical protein